VTFLIIRIQPLIVNSGTTTAEVFLRAVVDVFWYVASKSDSLTFIVTVHVSLWLFFFNYTNYQNSRIDWTVLVRKIDQSSGGSAVYIGGQGVAIIAAGGTDLYCQSEPPLTSGKLCFIINFIGRPQSTGGGRIFTGGALPFSLFWTAPGSECIEIVVSPVWIKVLISVNYKVLCLELDRSCFWYLLTICQMSIRIIKDTGDGEPLQ